MADLFTPQFLISVFEIILINILLSGDNAVVIALACRNLPDKLRRKGILWGVLGAIILRIVLTFFAMSLLEYPWIKLVGAALLIWIGIKLIVGEEHVEHEVKASDRLFSAVWTILIADLVMSLDNVMAVTAAAKGDLPLIIFGLVISIPLVIFGSQIIMRLIERLPAPGAGGRRPARLHRRRPGDRRSGGGTLDRGVCPARGLARSDRRHRRCDRSRAVVGAPAPPGRVGCAGSCDAFAISP